MKSETLYGRSVRGGIGPAALLLVCAAFLPAAASSQTHLPLGTVRSGGASFACGDLAFVESDHTPGTFGPTQTCTPLVVDNCRQLSPASAEIRVSDNAGTDGTVVFFSGSAGEDYWARNLRLPAGETSTDELLLQVDLTTGANDFKVVEVRWIEGWSVADAGPARAACRPATMLDWVLDQSAYRIPGTDACATGQSGGAHQLAYSMTHYDVAEALDGAIFTSGPVYSDLTLACGQSCNQNGNDFPTQGLGCFPAAARWIVDTSYGVPPFPAFRSICDRNNPNQQELCGEESFPGGLCMQHEHETNTSVMRAFSRDSVAVELGRWDYDYVNPGLSFLFGSTDSGPSPMQQSIFADAVAHNGNIQMPEEIEANHRLTDDPDGRRAILEDVADFCRAANPLE